MPPPVRRRGSGLLQNPWPGLLPSPFVPGLGPLDPCGFELTTRQSSRSLRPAALLLLASTRGSRGTPEVDYRAPLAACPGGTSTHWLFGPWLGTWLMPCLLGDCRASGEGAQGFLAHGDHDTRRRCGQRVDVGAIAADRPGSVG